MVHNGKISKEFCTKHLPIQKALRIFGAFGNIVKNDCAPFFENMVFRNKIKNDEVVEDAWEPEAVLNADMPSIIRLASRRIVSGHVGGIPANMVLNELEMLSFECVEVRKTKNSINKYLIGIFLIILTDNNGTTYKFKIGQTASGTKWLHSVNDDPQHAWVLEAKKLYMDMRNKNNKNKKKTKAAAKAAAPPPPAPPAAPPAPPAAPLAVAQTSEQAAPAQAQAPSLAFFKWILMEFEDSPPIYSNESVQGRIAVAQAAALAASDMKSMEDANGPLIHYDESVRGHIPDGYIVHSGNASE